MAQILKKQPYALQVELTKQNIRSIRKKLSRQGSIFSDKRYLDSLYLPSNIIGRQKQTEQLLGYLESMRQGSVVPVISVYGRSGAGKSNVVKFVCQNITDIASSAFVNLRKSKTIFGCANLILSELGSDILKSAEGLNKAVDKIGQKVEEILRREKKNFFVFILDEHDVIFSDLRGNPSDFVYKLLTLQENLREKGLWLCIITISNNALLDYDLDDRVKSRMGTNEIFFAPYSKSEILEILRDRASKAFLTKVDDSVLELCAQMSSEQHGDCRRAIELLRLSAELAGSQEITAAHVKKADKELDKDRIESIIANLPPQSKLVLATIAKLVLFSREEYQTTQDIYTAYMSIESTVRPCLHYRRVFDILKELDESGLIVARTKSRGRHGYANEYVLTAPTWMIGNVISKDWWGYQRDIQARQTKNGKGPQKRFKPGRDSY